MRQLKNFMKAKKPMWRCGECECITLKCWRENDAFCNCGTSSEGLGVEYAFKNWDGRILKQGSIDEGATPKAPADPTRAATAEYTYTFAGWDPEVGPISEDTVYTATYTSTVNEYLITFKDEDNTTLDEQTVAYGETPVYAGETPTKEATAQYTYTFSGWDPEIAPVTGTATYIAQYSATTNQYTVSIAPNDVSYGTVDENSITVDYGTVISAEGNVLTIGTENITATAETGYVFSSWGELPATVTEDLTITATFEAETPAEPGIELEDPDNDYIIQGEVDPEAPDGRAGASASFNFINIADPTDVTYEVLVDGISIQGATVTLDGPDTEAEYQYVLSVSVPTSDYVEGSTTIDVIYNNSTIFTFECQTVAF